MPRFDVGKRAGMRVGLGAGARQIDVEPVDPQGCRPEARMTGVNCDGRLRPESLDQTIDVTVDGDVDVGGCA